MRFGGWQGRPRWRSPSPSCARLAVSARSCQTQPLLATPSPARSPFKRTNNLASSPPACPACAPLPLLRSPFKRSIPESWPLLAPLPMHPFPVCAPLFRRPLQAQLHRGLQPAPFPCPAMPTHLVLAPLPLAAQPLQAQLHRGGSRCGAVDGRHASTAGGGPGCAAGFPGGAALCVRVVLGAACWFSWALGCLLLVLAACNDEDALDEDALSFPSDQTVLPPVTHACVALRATPTAQECMLPALNGLLAGEEWRHWGADLDRLW